MDIVFKKKKKNINIYMKEEIIFHISKFQLNVIMTVLI